MGQGFGLTLGGLKVRVTLSRQLREVSAALILDIYLKANLARPIAVRVERPVEPDGVRRDIPSQELCATAIGQGWRQLVALDLVDRVVMACPR